MNVVILRYFNSQLFDFYYTAHAEQTGWTPTEIKELTPGPMGPPAMGPPIGMTPPLGPPHSLPPSHVMGTPPFAPPFRSHLPPHAHERER